MRISHILLTAVLVSITAISCTRKNEVIEPAPRDVGGKTGKSTLKVTPRHHLHNIDGATVYIKYDTLGMVTTFDDSAVVSMQDGRPMVVFDSLAKGNYYLYAKALTNQDSLLSGGAGFTVIDTFENTYDLYLDVLLDSEKR